MEIKFLHGDILVEGIIEGKYTGNRDANSDADIYGINVYEKEKKEKFIQKNVEKTGKSEKSVEIYLNKFKIIFNKGVPNFEKCDTIRTYKKVKLFSNYYLPIEIVEITNFELIQESKTYTTEELIDKIQDELQKKIKKENNISDLSNVTYDSIYNVDNDGITLKVICTVEYKIGTKG